MKVKLKRTWFCPRGYRLRKGLHENLPDDWLEKLPSDAKVFDDNEEVPAEPNPDDLVTMDLKLAAMEAEQKLHDEADARIAKDRANRNKGEKK